MRNVYKKKCSKMKKYFPPEFFSKVVHRRVLRGLLRWVGTFLLFRLKTQWFYMCILRRKKASVAITREAHLCRSRSRWPSIIEYVERKKVQLHHQHSSWPFYIRRKIRNRSVRSWNPCKMHAFRNLWIEPKRVVLHRHYREYGTTWNQ